MNLRVFNIFDSTDHSFEVLLSEENAPLIVSSIVRPRFSFSTYLDHAGYRVQLGTYSSSIEPVFSVPYISAIFYYLLNNRDLLNLIYHQNI